MLLPLSLSLSLSLTHTFFRERVRTFFPEKDEGGGCSYLSHTHFFRERVREEAPCSLSHTFSEKGEGGFPLSIQRRGDWHSPLSFREGVTALFQRRADGLGTFLLAFRMDDPSFSRVEERGHTFQSKVRDGGFSLSLSLTHTFSEKGRV